MMRPIVILIFALLAWPRSTFAGANEDPTFRVHFLGDPQIGYGGTWEDTHRLKLVIDSLNRRSPDLVIVAGDLVQSRSPLETWLFDHALNEVKAKILLTPGNHDVVDVASLKRYREHYGPDYYLETHGQFAFLVINSETARSNAISETEHLAQWTFINDAILSATKKQQQLIIVTHRPPFLTSEHEPDSNEAWPVDTRKRLLSLCKIHGSCLILAGHLHRTHSVQTSDGVEIRVLPGSARSFDHSPIGYEELLFSGKTHQTHFRLVGPPPQTPLSIPGFREWTPRLFMFSAGHWAFTLLYLSAAYLCRRTHRRSGRGRSLWLPITWLLLFFAVNTQLDLDEFLREIGRIAAQLTGVSQIRHVITGTGLLVLAATGLWTLNRYRKSGTPGEELIAALALSVPGSWFILSTISHHDIRMVFTEFTWDILTLGALSTITLFALRARRISG